MKLIFSWLTEKAIEILKEYYYYIYLYYILTTACIEDIARLSVAFKYILYYCIHAITF